MLINFYKLNYSGKCFESSLKRENITKTELNLYNMVPISNAFLNWYF